MCYEGQQVATANVGVSRYVGIATNLKAYYQVHGQAVNRYVDKRPTGTRYKAVNSDLEATTDLWKGRNRKRGKILSIRTFFLIHPHASSHRRNALDQSLFSTATTHSVGPHSLSASSPEKRGNKTTRPFIPTKQKCL